MKKMIISAASFCALAGLAASLGLQAAGSRPALLARVYGMAGILDWAAWLWLVCAAGMGVYLFASGVLPRACLRLAGFRPGGNGSPEARALTFSFGFALALALAGALVSAARVNVYGGYACDGKAELNCQVRQGTLHMLYLPGAARPGSAPRSVAVPPENGSDTVYFSAASPAVGGTAAWPLAALFLVCVLAGRAALALCRRSAGLHNGPVV